MQVSLHPLAHADIHSAAEYYDTQRPGLGEEFVDVIEASIRRLAREPLISAKTRGNKRSYLVERFPYTIVYRVHAKRIRVLAVKHHAQHPDFGMDRR